MLPPNLSIKSTDNMDIALDFTTKQPSTATGRMDISTFLNPSQELGESELMESESTSTYSSWESSRATPGSSPSVCFSECPSPVMAGTHVQRPSFIDSRTSTITEGYGFSCQSLPSIRSILPNLGISSVSITEDSMHPSELSLQMSRCVETSPRRQRLQASPSLTSSIPRSHLPRVTRRRSHPSSRKNLPPIPVCNQRQNYTDSSQVFARKSNDLLNRPYTSPQQSTTQSQYLVQYESPARGLAPSQQKTAHNNRPYTFEQICWIRYYVDDLNHSWTSIPSPFMDEFPERFTTSKSTQSYSARYYRDNRYPHLSATGEPQYDNKGNLLTLPAPVRWRATTEGREVDFPYTLVDKWPQKVVEFAAKWKIGILERDLIRAKEILAGRDEGDVSGKRAEWRRLLNQCSDYFFKDDVEN